MKLSSIILIALAIASTTSPALARILTVNADGTAQYTTIQAAFNAVLSGDEILVEPGVYTGTGNVVVNMLGKTVLLHSSAGPENTIIDGQNVRAGIRCIATGNATIQGFTIRNGFGTEVEVEAGKEEGGLSSFGGGMVILNASPTILDCIFRNNSAVYGGGLHCFSSQPGISRPTLQNCTFEDNLADIGGGMRIHSSRPDLSGCTFSNNGARIVGGGIQNYQSHTISTDCVFTQNTAAWGGGWFNVDSNPRLAGCEFRNNVANADPMDGLVEGDSPGGAIYNFTAAGVQDSIPTIAGSIFCGNQPDTIWPTDSWRDLGGNQFENLCAPEVPDGGAGPFLRGDSNGDANLDLSDAISTLSFLFLGSDSPSCQAAADSNRDGNIDLTDAIYSLNFLFLAGEPLPAPTECGISVLESDIALGCENAGCG